MLARIVRYVTGRLIVVALTGFTALAVYWTYWNVDQAFYPNRTIHFDHVGSGYEFLIVPMDWVPLWLANAWLWAP